MLPARKRLGYAGSCGCNDAAVCGLLKWFVGCKLKELCGESACVRASVCDCLDVWCCRQQSGCKRCRHAAIV